jgi:hypothetical protein
MAQTAAMAQDHQRLWVFRRYDGSPAESSKRFALLARGHRVRHWQLDDTVRLYLYERSAP